GSPERTITTWYPFLLARLYSVATVATLRPRRFATASLLLPISFSATTWRSRKLSLSAPRISICIGAATLREQVIHRLCTTCGQHDDKLTTKCVQPISSSPVPALLPPGKTRCEAGAGSPARCVNMCVCGDVHKQGCTQL